jgi:phosphoesterase RecJ-like protein
MSESTTSARIRGRRAATRSEVAALLAAPEGRIFVASHRNPDGDALGSMIGLARSLRAAGRDVTVVHPDAAPVPPDLSFVVAPGEVIEQELPAEVSEGTLIALDCASEARLWDGTAPWGAGLLVNVDHHHDNTRFGDLNLIEPTASSTAEVVHALLVEAGLPIDRHVAEPLYVGIITDTGRFSYPNTSPSAHRTAAALLELGVDGAEIARTLYEAQPIGRMRLMGVALQRAELALDGGLMVAALTQEDFLAVEEVDTEGIVEAMRCVAGVHSAALARQLPSGAYRLSLRTSRSDLDVSAIAREEGGGGHRAAAGFTTERQPEELFRWIADRLAAQGG